MSTATKLKELIKKHAALFEKIEQQYGVPAPIITAFWGLESGFGADIGKFEVLRSLATLAYDCRRSERFRGELLSALKIIERGDLTPDNMIGSWAGELEDFGGSQDGRLEAAVVDETDGVAHEKYAVLGVGDA